MVFIEIFQKCQYQDQFKNKRYITEHYARHHHDHYKGLPYKCEKCGKGFKINKDLQRHRKRPHNEDYMSYKIICPEPGCGKRFRKDWNDYSAIHCLFAATLICKGLLI